LFSGTSTVSNTSINLFLGYGKYRSDLKQKYARTLIKNRLMVSSSQTISVTLTGIDHHGNSPEFCYKAHWHLEPFKNIYFLINRILSI